MKLKRFCEDAEEILRKFNISWIEAIELYYYEGKNKDSNTITVEHAAHVLQCWLTDYSIVTYKTPETYEASSITGGEPLASGDDTLRLIDDAVRALCKIIDLDSSVEAVSNSDIIPEVEPNYNLPICRVTDNRCEYARGRYRNNDRGTQKEFCPMCKVSGVAIDISERPKDCSFIRCNICRHYFKETSPLYCSKCLKYSKFEEVKNV